MGKAALDLPDPLQAPPQEARASTDDLLAQLAGDEIDRLLAEADAGQPAVNRAPFHVGPPTGTEKSSESGVETPSLAAPAAPPQPSKLSPTEIEVAAEMDALFSAAVAKDEADAQKAAVAAAAAETEAETSAAERDGLKAPATIGSTAHPKPFADEDAPVPFYLYPLVWLNAPLTILPESVRDIVGKVAIVTLINAAAILAYVLVVRRAQ